MAVVVAAADRAVRSAGNSALDLDDSLRPLQCGLKFFEVGINARSGFTPEVALPIIAALGGGLDLALRP